MEKFLLNLRSRSEVERKRILFISLAIIMSIIIGIWIYSITHTFNQNIKVESNKEEEVSPFKLLGQKFNDTYKNMSANVSDAKFFRKENTDIQNTNLKEEKVIDLIPIYK